MIWRQWTSNKIVYQYNIFFTIYTQNNSVGRIKFGNTGRRTRFMCAGVDIHIIIDNFWFESRMSSTHTSRKTVIIAVARFQTPTLLHILSVQRDIFICLHLKRFLYLLVCNRWHCSESESYSRLIRAAITNNSHIQRASRMYRVRLEIARNTFLDWTKRDLQTFSICTTLICVLCCVWSSSILNKRFY